jgi:uncharacterized coiled-coil protein SlyX
MNKRSCFLPHGAGSLAARQETRKHRLLTLGGTVTVLLGLRDPPPNYKRQIQIRFGASSWGKIQPERPSCRAMDEASTALFSLKPVTFRYKPEFDKSGTPHFGLIAEEVAEVSPDLVIRNAKGELSTVRYEAVNAMLLNKFLKEHRKNEQQEATIALLKSTDAKQEAIIAQQQKQIEALTAGLQKVSAQLELSKPAPRAVVTNEENALPPPNHRFRSASLNAIVRSTLPVESKIRISPERKQARFCA